MTRAKYIQIMSFSVLVIFWSANTGHIIDIQNQIDKNNAEMKRIERIIGDKEIKQGYQGELNFDCDLESKSGLCHSIDSRITSNEENIEVKYYKISEQFNFHPIIIPDGYCEDIGLFETCPEAIEYFEKQNKGNIEQ